MRLLVADIEANGLLDTVTDIWQVSIAEKIDGEWVLDSYNRDTLHDGFDRLYAADKIVGHYFLGYDVPAIKLVTGVQISATKIIDTIVLSRLANPERGGGHSLASWGLELGHPKVEHEDWTQWSPEMQVRCDEDVMINVKVWEKLEPMLHQQPMACHIEHRTAAVIARMCETGVHFDVAGGYRLLDELMSNVENLRGPLEQLLPYVYKRKGKTRSLKRKPNKAHWAHGNMEAASEFTEVQHVKLEIGSRLDVVRYLKDKHGWIPTELTKTGLPKLNAEVLADLPWAECTQFAEYFKTIKILGYLNAEVNASGYGGGWLQHVTDEGKLHAGFIPLTAVTGRPSCVAPNLQQVPTDQRVRALFGPRAGWVQVGVDAEGQELRCLGHYMTHYDGGSYAREVVEGDIHTRIQKLIGFHDRTTTKPVEYGLIYGAGNPKLGMLSAKDAVAHNMPYSKNYAKVGKAIRKAILDGLVGYKELNDTVMERAKAQGKLRGIDGRTLWVRSPRSALNLIMQSAGIIHMKMAISMLDEFLTGAGLVQAQDYELILWVHDELQFECKPEHAELLGKTVAACLEEAAVRLGFKLPMTGEYKIGNNWSECH